MVLISGKKKPIKIFGIVLVVFCFVSVVFFWNLFLNQNSATFIAGENPPPKEIVFVGILMIIFYLVAGFGAISNRPAGILFFKVFLCLLFLAFPIGTIISYRTLKYINKYSVG